MKKLLMAAMVSAMAAGAVAEDVKPVAPAEKPVAVKTSVPGRPKFDRAKFEERMKARRLERMEKVTAAAKAAGLDEAKAKALAEEIDKIYTARPQRPPRMIRQAPAEKK